MMKSIQESRMSWNSNSRWWRKKKSTI